MSIKRPPWGKYILALVTMQWMVPPHRKKISGYLSWQISNDNSFCYRVSIRRISGFPLALQIAGCHKFFLCIGDHNARFPLHDLFSLLHLLKIFHYLKFSVILIFGWSAHIQKLLTHKNFQLQYM